MMIHAREDGNHENPGYFLALRRYSMLLLGITGGLFFAVFLCLSVKQTTILNRDHSIESFSGKEESEKNVQKVAFLPKADITFPYSIPGTTICIKEISNYDGPFVEDGSDREVVGVTALLITNYGSNEIQQTSIELKFGELCLTFLGDHIPGGATVLLLEKNAQGSLQKNFTSCCAWQIENHEYNRLHSFISVKDMAMGTLIVTNHSEERLEHIRLYYKTWLSEQGILVGGITYCVEIPVLNPGQTEYLYPKHYASDYSVVVSAFADEQYNE